MDPITLTKEQIRAIVPQMPTLFLFEEVTELFPGKSLRARYVAPPENPEYQIDHFPAAFPVQLAAMSSVLLERTVPRLAHRNIRLLAINNARYYREITPGETVDVAAEVVHIRDDDKLIFTIHTVLSRRGEKAVELETVDYLF